MFKTILSLIIVLFSLNLFGQYNVQIIDKDELVTSFYVADSVEAFSKLNNFLSKKYKKGYIAASFDTIVLDSSNFKAFFSENERFYWSDVIFVNSSDSSNYKHFNFRKFKNKPVNFEFIDDKIDEVLYDYSCKGYPFSQINYDSFLISGNTINAKIIIKKNNFIQFDSIYFDPNVNLRGSFLENYLQFNKNDVYNVKIIEGVSDKLSVLPFIQVVMPSEIEFHSQTADLFLYLKNQRANSFSGIIGFSNANQKFSVVGQADIKIYNIFKNADNINLKWEKTKSLSQNLDLDFSFPYIFSTKLGISNILNIVKFDTSYVSVYNHSALSYFFSGFNNVALFADFQTSIVFDTLSDFKNFTSKVAGLSLNIHKINDFFVPSKGFVFQFSAGAGTKNAVDSSSQQMTISQNIEFFVPVLDNFVLMYKNYTNILLGRYLFENELFKFGGANLMRGFDEKSLRASFLNLNTFEIKYLLLNKSSVFIFSDYSIMQHKSTTKNYWKHPVGVGGGFSLSTKTGVLTITYALGKTENQNFIFNNSKLHFGFFAFF